MVDLLKNEHLEANWCCTSAGVVSIEIDTSDLTRGTEHVLGRGYEKVLRRGSATLARL